MANKKTFRLGVNEKKFLDMILEEEKLNYNAPKDDFVKEQVKREIREKLEYAYNQGHYFS